MSKNDNPHLVPVDTDETVAEIRGELEKLNPDLKKRALEKFALAALGSIPWVGGFISAAVRCMRRG